MRLMSEAAPCPHGELLHCGRGSQRAAAARCRNHARALCFLLTAAAVGWSDQGLATSAHEWPAENRAAATPILGDIRTQRDWSGAHWNPGNDHALALS